MSGLTQRYISNELVHFVGRGMESQRQFDLLCKILSEGWITHPPHKPNISGNLKVDPGVSISTNVMYSPQITCFADIPVSELSIHIEKYSPFGLSFSKDFITQAGGAPVHYLPIDSKVIIFKDCDKKVVPKGQYFDEMLQEYHKLFSIFVQLAQKVDPNPGVSGLFQRVIELQRFFDVHIFSYIKFFDHRKTDVAPENFYFEREWRIVGNVSFTMDDVKTVFSPRCFSNDFREAFPQYAGQVIFTD